MIDFEALAAPFPPERISWRVGTSNKARRKRETGDNYAKATKGMALAYIDARDVMGRLDEVCGPGGWQCKYSHAEGKTVCDIGVKVGDEWVWKADGAGNSDIEAEKGALSDAFKRAAVRWGIGRYLYDISSPWCDLDDREQITEADRQKLEAMLEKHTSDFEWGSPGEKAMARALYQTIKSTVLTTDGVRLYREQNKGVLANLRKAPREQIDALLERIIETSNQKAA